MAAKKLENQSFEVTMAELDTIVQQLEQGDLPLEEALKQFERGVHLIRAGQHKLEQAEQKVQLLMADGQQEKLVPFAPEQGEQ